MAGFGETRRCLVHGSLTVEVHDTGCRELVVSNDVEAG
jgi:hypothetical protein